MLIRLGYDLEITCDGPTELVALMDPHPDCARHLVASSGTEIFPPRPSRIYPDLFGNACLRFTAEAGATRLRHDSLIEVDDAPEIWPEIPSGAGTQAPPVGSHAENPLAALPDEVIGYLLASRYCETDLMMAQAWDLFGQTEPGWPRIRAIFDHVNRHLEFGYNHARATRTAAEAWQERRGVCRDFAHLAITFCRCLNIPARYANGYLGDIGVPANPSPMDFNAWCEVWLDGRWITLDARHNSRRIGRVVIARGRDATDIPLLHSFGPHRLTQFRVWTEEADATTRLAPPLSADRDRDYRQETGQAAVEA